LDGKTDQQGSGGVGGLNGGNGAKGKRKQLLLSVTRASDAGGNEEGRGEVCSQVALALALSASVEGHMSVFMRRRRQVARSLAELCLWHDFQHSELHSLLQEFVPSDHTQGAEAVDKYGGANAGGGRPNTGICLPSSRLSGARWATGSSAGRKGGIGAEEGLWRIGALGAPECEEDAGVFYNGVLGRRSLSQFEGRPHVFHYDSKKRDQSAQGGDLVEGADVVAVVDVVGEQENEQDPPQESVVLAHVKSIDSNVESGTGGRSGAHGLVAEFAQRNAGEQETCAKSEQVEASVFAAGAQASATALARIDLQAAAATPEDLEEFCVPDSEGEEAELQDRNVAQAAHTSARESVKVVADAASLEEAGVGMLKVETGGLEAVEAGAEAESEDDDSGMLSRLLELMSSSEDEEEDGEREVWRDTSRSSNRDKSSKASSNSPDHSAAPAALSPTTSCPTNVTSCLTNETGGGGREVENAGGVVCEGGLETVLPLVQARLAGLSPRARASAKAPIEQAVCATVEVSALLVSMLFGPVATLFLLRQRHSFVLACSLSV
jgi:hypothetical protein